MLESQRPGPVGVVPVRGPQVQRLDQVRLDPTELTQQELAEEGVVAEPAAASIQRNQEQARGLQSGELRLRTGLPEDRVAQGGAHLVDDRRSAQEPLHTIGQLSQGLAVQVVGDVPVVTGDREDIAVAVPGDRRGEVEAGGPSFGACGHGGSRLGRDLHVGLGEDLPRPRGIQSQVTGHQLHGVARGP